MSLSENCYNRGCGQKFDPAKNTEESCTFHPGVPFFHDAYKGWSCCNKKSVDFTEFLNIKGCTAGPHSNVKPPEPEKANKELEVDVPEEPVKIIAPLKGLTLDRPNFDGPLTQLEPKVAQNLKDAIDNFKVVKPKPSETFTEIQIGTVCKNRGCNSAYESSESKFQDCLYHPGYPVFHEGLKYWSCCTKRTTDFTAFMNQVGCASGTHKWTQDDHVDEFQCRYDWHQTAANVVIAIYAKMYHYQKSYIRVNPIRLTVKLVFPATDAEFNMDLELRGVIDISKTTVNMLGSKIEITMPKAEPGLWSNLVFPRTATPVKSALETKKEEVVQPKGEDSDSDIDLDCVEAIGAGPTITELD